MDFLVKFFHKQKVELSQMDTDWLYFAVSGESVEQILKPEMRFVYYRERHLCIDEYVATKVAKQSWHLKPCWAERLKFDKRTYTWFVQAWVSGG